ncbi:MAG: hypothetical protein NC086_02940 [Alistipes sp.]|nr:hypothetical protein [Alistipes sp.]
MKREKAEHNEAGMMTVEVCLSFTIFIMAVVFIIMLTNIYTLHNRIQFAINSAAHEMASYSYIYEALGVRGAESAVKADGAAYTQNIDTATADVVDTLNKINTLRTDSDNLITTVQGEYSLDTLGEISNQIQILQSDVTATGESVKQAATSIGNLLSDPQATFAGIVYLGIDAGIYGIHNFAGSILANLLTKKYLALGSGSADDYLEKYGVIGGYDGLDFTGSSLFNDSGNTQQVMVDIVVQYDVDLSFIAFVLPDSKIHVVQRVSVPAWLRGDGNADESKQ